MTAAWQATLVRFLEARGFTADAGPRNVGPQVATLHVRPRHAGHMPRILKMQAEVTAALNVPECTLRQVGAFVAVEVPLPAHMRRAVPFVPCMAGSALRVYLGESAQGRPVSIDLASDRTPHALIVGMSGSGKSVLLQAILAGCLAGPGPSALEVIAIDSDRRTFEPFARLPQLTHGIVYGVRAAADALAYVASAIDERTRTPGEHPPVIVAIDEAHALAGTPAERTLAGIIARGRKFGVHVLAATQYVNASVLDPRIATQFGARIAGRVDSARTSSQVLGVAGAGAERLLGDGDMLGVLGGGRPLRFRASMCKASDFAMLEKIRGTLDRTEPEAEDDEPAPVPYYLKRRELDDDARDWIIARVKIDDVHGLQMPGTPGVKAAFGVGTSTARRWIDEVRDLIAVDGATLASPAKAPQGGQVLPFALPAMRREALEA